jgi:hypothetical protein
LPGKPGISNREAVRQGGGNVFLYTKCPTCQAGVDLARLFEGKKIYCASCARAYSVVAMPRPRSLPPLAPFPRPSAASPPEPASAVSQSPLAAVNFQRPIAKMGANSPRPSTTSGGSGWGKGGAWLVIIAISVVGAIIRSSTRPTNPAPPPVRLTPQPQFQMPPLPVPPQQVPPFGGVPPNGNDPGQDFQKLLDDIRKKNNQNPPFGGVPPNGNDPLKDIRKPRKDLQKRPLAPVGGNPAGNGINPFPGINGGAKKDEKGPDQ